LNDTRTPCCRPTCGCRPTTCSKGILADKGGTENLTTLNRELAQQARNFRMMLDLILHDLVRTGVTTRRGGVRSAVSKYLEIFHRFGKCAQPLGLEREAWKAMSRAAQLAAALPLTSDTEERDATDRPARHARQAIERAGDLGLG
jgi:hypothetical protein